VEDELNVSQSQLDLIRVKQYKDQILEKRLSKHLSRGFLLTLLFFLICFHAIIVI